MFGLTKEADGALRIAWVLGMENAGLPASEIARRVSVPLQFTLKILHRLSEGGLVTARRGKFGGYALAHAPRDISLRQVIEQIDGPITVNRCVEQGFVCSRMGENKRDCSFHCLFTRMSQALAEQLDGVTLEQMITSVGVTDPTSVS